MADVELRIVDNPSKAKLLLQALGFAGRSIIQSSRSFSHSTSGSVSILLALGATILVGSVSAGLDYSRMTSVRSSLASATDAAALAAAQASKNDAGTIAQQVFDANFRGVSPVTSFSAKLEKKGDSESYRVEASADVPMTLSQVLGFSSRSVSAVSEVALGQDEDLLVALALDVTGSMAGQKLKDLKAAATSMTNDLYDSMKRSNQVKMAIIPFARYVNVGLPNRNKSWMSVPPDSKTTAEVCSQKRDVVRTYNCRDEFRSWTSCNDGVCTQHSGTTKVCDREYGPYYQSCEKKTTEMKWQGCVGSRDYPYNTLDDTYVTKPVPGIMNVSCPRPITELSTSRPTILKAISELSASGETYIPSGLKWGWASLSPGEPFDAKTDEKNITRRILILMTDGANTVSPSYPKHDDSNAAVANKLTSELCTNAKAAKIEIFTIALQVGSAAVEQLLLNCSSTPSNFFKLENSGQLKEAFESIRRRMSSLRLTK